jgi:hypothetical protein
MKSLEFQELLEFLDKQYNIHREEAMGFIESIEMKKNILDYRVSQEFFEQAVKRDFHGMPILSTGGYNDRFLTFVSHVFNTQVVKCRGDYLNFVVKAIDYLNKHTNDCFFVTHGSSRDHLAECGKLDPH